MIIKKYSYLCLFLCVFWMIQLSPTDEKSILTKQVFSPDLILKYKEYLFISPIKNLEDLSRVAQRVIDTDAEYRKAAAAIFNTFKSNKTFRPPKGFKSQMLEDFKNEMIQDFKILRNYLTTSEENHSPFNQKKYKEKENELNIVYQNSRETLPEKIYPEDTAMKQNYFATKEEREKAFNVLKNSKLELIRFCASMSQISTDFNKNFRKKLFSDSITEHYRKELDMHIKEDLLIEDNKGRLNKTLKQINLCIQNTRENKPLKDWDFDLFRDMICNIYSRFIIPFIDDYDGPNPYQLGLKKFVTSFKITGETISCTQKTNRFDILENALFKAKQECTDYFSLLHSIPNHKIQWFIDAQSDCENYFKDAIFLLKLIKKELKIESSNSDPLSSSFS